jgi:uncharacterized protein YndB with AHSA1/START domain
LPLSSRPVTARVLLPHPVRRVWQALTDPSALSVWFLLTTDFEPTRGHIFRLRRRGDAPSAPGSELACEILRVRHPSLLSFQIDDPDGPALRGAIVTWTVYTAAGGTAVEVTHGSVSGDSVVPQAARDAMQSGWRVYLCERLPAYLLTAGFPG